MMRYVYCHPLFEERKCAQRFTYTLEQVFLRNDRTLQWFDYRGTGEAPGAFCDVTMHTLREDTADFIGEDCVWLIGLRLGATLAFDFFSIHQEQVAGLTLIEPILDGSAYIDYLMRKQELKDALTGNTPKNSATPYVNLEGYKTHPTLLSSLSSLRLPDLNCPDDAGVPVHLIHVALNDKHLGAYQELIERWRSKNHPTLDYFCLSPFWERIPNVVYSQITERIHAYCHEHNGLFSK